MLWVRQPTRRGARYGSRLCRRTTRPGSLWLRSSSGHRHLQMEQMFGHGREGTEAREGAPCAAPPHRVHTVPDRRMRDGYVVHSDLSEALPVTGDEVALLRAFLSAEIRAILQGEDQGG